MVRPYIVDGQFIKIPLRLCASFPELHNPFVSFVAFVLLYQFMRGGRFEKRPYCLFIS